MENSKRNSSLDGKNGREEGNPEVGRPSKTISDFCKATAPVWLLVCTIGIIFVGIWLIVFGSLIHLYFGVGMILMGWLSLAVGWRVACDMSRTVLNGHH